MGSTVSVILGLVLAVLVLVLFTVKLKIHPVSYTHLTLPTIVPV